MSVVLFHMFMTFMTFIRPMHIQLSKILFHCRAGRVDRRSLKNCLYCSVTIFWNLDATVFSKNFRAYFQAFRDAYRCSRDAAAEPIPRRCSCLDESRHSLTLLGMTSLRRCIHGKLKLRPPFGGNSSSSE